MMPGAPARRRYGLQRSDAGLRGCASMLMTFVVFVGYGLAAASFRNHEITRPRVLAWMRRTLAAAFVALGAKLAFSER